MRQSLHYCNGGGWGSFSSEDELHHILCHKKLIAKDKWSCNIFNLTYGPDYGYLIQRTEEGVFKQEVLTFNDLIKKFELYYL